MNNTSFTEMPKSYKHGKNIAHYRWCAEHEGQRTLRAIEAGAMLSAYHHARDAAHWAIMVLDLTEQVEAALTRPVCPNCGQWINPGAGNMPTDCLNECHRRGLA